MQWSRQHTESILKEAMQMIVVIENVGKNYKVAKTTYFVLKPGDFNIEIPKVVSSKIAEEINVSATYLLN